AGLSGTSGDDDRTRLFAWYTLAGALATALGALAGGFMGGTGAPAVVAGDRYRPVILLYAVLGLLLAGLFWHMSPGAEPVSHDAPPSSSGPIAQLAGLDSSHGVVLRLAGLFALDAFGGGFVAQSFAAYWFHLRFGAEPAALGVI